MNKVEKIDDMFVRLLDMNLVQEDNTVIFTEESKKLIKEIADKCRQTEL